MIAGVSNDAADDCKTYGGTAITGCRFYEASTAGAETCAVAKDGYYLEATPATAAQTKQCLTNCAKCNGPAFASCSTAATGFFLDTAAITACVAGCGTCNGPAAASCTAAREGFYLAGGAITACPDGKGAPAAATASTQCTDCNATCATCTKTDFC